MRVLIINPNASVEMSAVIRGQVEAVARPGTAVEVVNPPGAPPVVESAQDEAQAIPPTLELVRAAAERGYDSVVIACFSDPGLDAARELTEVPVVGIQESAMHLAAQIADRFSILTPLSRRVPVREHAALRYGLDRRLASCRVLDLPVIETVGDREQVLGRVVEVGRQAVDEDGAEALILGCAGLGDLAPRAARILGVPVVDPNQAALKVCEMLVDLGLSHSKARLWSPLDRDWELGVGSRGSGARDARLEQVAR